MSKLEIGEGAREAGEGNVNKLEREERVAAGPAGENEIRRIEFQ